VVGILINHHGITIPEPVIAEAVVVWRNAEVVATEPETAPVASLEPEAMVGAEPALKVSMFPRVIDVVVRIAATGIVSDPMVVMVNVWSVRMPGVIDKSAAGGMIHTSGRAVIASGWIRTMRRNVATAETVSSTTSLTATSGVTATPGVTATSVLRVAPGPALDENRNRKHQQHDNKSEEFLHFITLLRYCAIS
jgi:hypothetical protein